MGDNHSAGQIDAVDANHTGLGGIVGEALR